MSLITGHTFLCLRWCRLGIPFASFVVIFLLLVRDAIFFERISIFKDLAEGLLDKLFLFCTSLNERHVSSCLAQTLCFFLRDLPCFWTLICFINFVPNEQDSALFSFTVDNLKPFSHIVEAFSVCDIVDDDYSSNSSDMI